MGTQLKLRSSSIRVRAFEIYEVPLRQVNHRDLPGKILNDSKTVESCEIKEKDFLVLMVSKVSPRKPPTSLIEC